MRNILFLLLVISVFYSCNEQVSFESIAGETYYPKYAKGFYLKGNTLIIRSTSNPEIIITEYEIDRNKPARKMVLYSATHIAMAKALGLVDSIVGVSHLNYIKNPTIHKNYELGKITELNQQINENIETLIELNPDIIMVSHEQYSTAKKTDGLKLPYIVNQDYLESTPLARIEWIKVLGYFYNKDREADIIFDDIENKYLELVELANKTSPKTIFSGLPYQGAWFVPGGNSYKANFLKDAGVNYVFENSNSESIQVDFETILDKAIDTDYWEFITHSDTLNYATLIDQDNRFSNFKAVKNKNVVYCNTKKADIYETGIIEPHIILSDLIHAFHPELMPDYSPKYYQRLQE